MPAVPSNPANYCFPTWKYGIYPFPGEITRSAARQWKAACSCTVKAHCGKHSSLISLYIASVSHRCIPKWSLLIWFLGSHKIQLLFCYLQHGFWACERSLALCSPPQGTEDPCPHRELPGGPALALGMSLEIPGTHITALSSFRVRDRNSCLCFKILAVCQIPGYLKLSLEVISKQGLRYPEGSLEGIQAPEYKIVSTELWSAVLHLFSKIRGA